MSGARVNPGITTGPASAGNVPWASVPAYTVARILGGVLAALTVWAAFGPAALNRADLGSPALVENTNAFRGFMVEALIAFSLVFVITGFDTDNCVPSGTASIAIGFALAAGVLIAGPVSGGAGNPARAFGPMVVSGSWDTFLTYVIGPVVGGIIGALVYVHLIGRASPPEMPFVDTRTTDAPHRTAQRSR